MTLFDFHIYHKEKFNISLGGVKEERKEQGEGKIVIDFLNKLGPGIKISSSFLSTLQQNILARGPLFQNMQPNLLGFHMKLNEKLID